MMPRLALLALVLAAALPAPAAAGTPEEDLAWLNQRRSANGLPGDLALDPNWSRACAAHLRYRAVTGVLGHVEDPLDPAYSVEGAWAAANSVLAIGIRWTADDLFWETAPLHMAQLLMPALQRVGIADQGEAVCVTTWPGATRTLPSVPSVLVSPGQGASAMPAVSTAEWPVTPAEAVGYANPTGPHLYVYQWGPAAASGVGADGRWIGIRTASLRGPDGEVEVRWVDRRHERVGPFLPLASGIVIPGRPLRAGASYLARVQFTNGVERAWSFVTSGALVPYATRRIGVRPLETRRVRTCVRRTSAGCAAWATRFRQWLRVTGRVVRRETGTGVSGVRIIVGCDGAEVPPVATRRNGAFATACRAIGSQRRFRFTLTIRDTGAIAAARVVKVSVLRSDGGFTGRVTSVASTVYPPPGGLGPPPVR